MWPRLAQLASAPPDLSAGWTGDGIPIRVCSVPGKERLGRFALRAAERFLHWYDEWFTVKYPFGKLDMVAVPDYEWGGMENAASIFYKERAMLLDEAHALTSPSRSKPSASVPSSKSRWAGCSSWGRAWWTKAAARPMTGGSGGSSGRPWPRSVGAWDRRTPTTDGACAPAC
jgi:Peptidase family M1 domain